MPIPSALSNTGLQILPPTITKPHYPRTLHRLPLCRSLRECLSFPLQLSLLPRSYCKSHKFIFLGYNDGFAFNFPPDLSAGRTEVIYIPLETTLATTREAFWKQRLNRKKNSLFFSPPPFFFLSKEEGQLGVSSPNKEVLCNPSETSHVGKHLSIAVLTSVRARGGR